MALYADVNPYYGRAPSVGRLKGDYRIKIEDTEAIAASIRTIFCVRPGEMFFLPEFGANPEDYLFDIIDDLTSQSLYALIIGQIARWEPRVEIDNRLSAVIPRREAKAYDVHLVFRVRGFDAPTEVNFRLNSPSA